MSEQLKMKFKCFEFRGAEKARGCSPDFCYDCLDTDGSWVGAIEYCSSWREWVFLSDEGTLLSRDRLQDITNFLEQLHAKGLTPQCLPTLRVKTGKIIVEQR